MYQICSAPEEPQRRANRQAVKHCARNTPTSQRMTGTRVPSGCSAAALRHHSTRLPMSSQEWGDDSGAEVPASSRRSSIALASLQDTVSQFFIYCPASSAAVHINSTGVSLTVHCLRFRKCHSGQARLMAWCSLQSAGAVFFCDIRQPAARRAGGGAPTAEVLDSHPWSATTGASTILCTISEAVTFPKKAGPKRGTPPSHNREQEAASWERALGPQVHLTTQVSRLCWAGLQSKLGPALQQMCYKVPEWYNTARCSMSSCLFMTHCTIVCCELSLHLHTPHPQ